MQTHYEYDNCGFLPSKKIQNVFHFHLWAANMAANIKAASFGQCNKSEKPNQIWQAWKSDNELA